MRTEITSSDGPGRLSPPLLALAAEAHLRVGNHARALELDEARNLLSTLS